MRGVYVLVATSAMMAVVGSVRADGEPKYTLREHLLVVDDGTTHEEIPIPCDEVRGAARHDARIFVACGKQGLAVFSASDPMHPRFEELRVSPVSCVDVTPEGACVDRAPPLQYGLFETGPYTTIHVIGAPKDLEIQAMNPDGTWSTVCTGTCDRPLPSDGTYRADGPGLRASKPFGIYGDVAHLTVTTGSWAGFGGGLTLFIVGMGVGVVGVGALLLDGLVHLFCQSDCGPDNLLALGLIGSLGGTAVATGGLYMMNGNGRTHVEGETTAPRLPAWRETPSAPTTMRFGFVGVPLLSGTF